MTKKTMGCALAVVSAALFAMPAVASANWGVDPVNQSFSATSDLSISGSPFVMILTAEGEPTVTCEGPSHVSGAWTDGTQGSISLDFTSCHVSAVFTIPCHSAGAPVSNTILMNGAFKNVTIAADPSGRKRGITMTPQHTVIECAGISSLTVTGRIIGRITNDPAPSPSGCGVIDSSFTLEFLISGGKQDPLRTDSMSISESDDLTAQTGSESPKTAALEDKWPISTATNTTWTCNAP
jgi:hypothetical protein